MPKFHVITGPDATPAYPIVRKIGPADLKDALAKGVDDFWAMPTSLVFLGLIYPIVGMCLAGFALPNQKEPRSAPVSSSESKPRRRQRRSCVPRQKCAQPS